MQPIDTFDVSFGGNSEKVQAQTTPKAVEGNAVYFAGLNQLRCFAALAVVVQHIEQFKSVLGYPSLFGNFTIGTLGLDGVRLFFVISGFLITYLLFTEMEKTGSINITKFYFRRALRIWPLYYLTVFLGFFVVPHIWTTEFVALRSALSHNFNTELIMFAVFVPNLCSIMYPPVICAAQCWTLGVEEQFYAIWPWLIKFSKRATVFGIIGAVLIKYGLIEAIQQLSSYALPIRSQHGMDIVSAISIFKTFLVSFDLESLAIGGLAAYYFLHHKNSMGFVIQKPIFTVLLYSCLAVSFTCSYPFHEQIATVLFALLVLYKCITVSSESLFNRLCEHIGKTSYSLYMLHPISLLLTFWFLSATGLKSIGDLPFAICSSSLGIASSLAASQISFYCFESNFLKMKKRFEIIATKV